MVIETPSGMIALPELPTTVPAAGSCLQLVPAGGGGVNDYAASLRAHGLHGEVVHLAFPIFVAWEKYDTVLLQYSGYGYARRGAPLWLLAWLRRERPRIKKLVIFFHELYATSAPWQSAFWLSPIQRHIAIGLADISDLWMTNRQGSADWLVQRGAVKPHVVLPTSSGVGEWVSPNNQKKPQVVVFGGAGLRQATYSKGGRRLLDWIHSSELELHDIGPPTGAKETLGFLKEAHAICHGHMKPGEVSAVLRNSMFGVLSYSVSYAAKSSVLGAYCAHALCPVIFGDGSESLDGLVQGLNYVDGMDLRYLEFHTAYAIGLSAWNWYQPHAVQRHVDAVIAIDGLAAPTSASLGRLFP